MLNNELPLLISHALNIPPITSFNSISHIWNGFTCLIQQLKPLIILTQAAWHNGKIKLRIFTAAKTFLPCMNFK
ncbi:hypothetical protein DND58_30435 [Pseudomonas syringae pv. pisi]|nr:hypothetical protein DND58_30435 [Pseudomonas syringae pv. pisi]